MTRVDDHPVSCFELDVYWSSGRPPGSPLESHVRTCEACRRFLDQLDRLAVEPAPMLDPQRAQAAGRARLARRIVKTASLGAALAVSSLCAFLAVRPRPAPVDAPSAYVGIKGIPAVQVLVRTPTGTEIWDGHAPVHPGDRLALQVACEGFSHVTVAAPTAEAHGWTRLADASCSAEASVLPFTLVVDAQPGGELIAVVVSTARIDDGSLESAAALERRADDRWVTHLRFSKSPVRP